MENIIWASRFKANVSIQIILEKMYSFQSDLHRDDFLIYFTSLLSFLPQDH